MEAADFVTFVVPRALQFLIDLWVGGGLLTIGSAQALYVGLCYGSAVLLWMASARMLSPFVHDGRLHVRACDISRLVPAAALAIFGLGAALAPAFGLSLMYCYVSAARFASQMMR